MKRVLLFCVAFAIVLMTLQASVTAQTPEPKIIKGGLINGKAVHLPKPKYPEELKASKIGGVARVQVTIDEEGNVISAGQPTEPMYKKEKDGTVVPVETEPIHPLLQEAAEKAALEAKFAPTMLSGVPVKVSGVIVYNFVADESVAPDTPKTVNGGGVMNGKARSLPRPEYPPAARAVRAGGTVTVQVVVDENGDVISANALSGHPLLRSAAVEAARKAKFAPTFVDGNPVEVTGVLTYNFVPPPERGTVGRNY